jgi:hypothetical protein
MHLLFKKITSNQILWFVSIVVLFSIFFISFREGLEVSNKLENSLGRCDAAKSCDACGQIAYDSSGSTCYWCGVDKGCKSSSEYYDMSKCAKGCSVIPNPPPDQQKKYPSTDITPEISGNFFPVNPKNPPYNPGDIEACESPCAWNSKGYCKLRDEVCPYKKEIEKCEAPCSWNSKGVCSTLQDLPCNYIKPIKSDDTRNDKAYDISRDKSNDTRNDKSDDYKPSDKNKVPEPVSWPLSCKNVSMFRGKIYLNPSDFLEKVV